MKITFILFFIFFYSFLNNINAQVPSTIQDFFMPGSQPHMSGTLPDPAGCNCHDLNKNDFIVEGWEGSMMAHAARDQLFLATMSIANQDAPESGDLCLRCHTPTGWLSGRSEPTDGSALDVTEGDYTSVNCLFCHRSLMPSDPGVNPFPDDPNYTNPDCTSTNISTFQSDSIYITDSLSIHTNPSFIPPTTANGMYVVTNEDVRRGPYATINNPNHGYYYSPFHIESEICGTCHDVSNPVFTNNHDGSYSPNTFGQARDFDGLDYDPYEMFPIERTYSEWKNSSYNTDTGVYAPNFGGNKDNVSTCQDCHMKDVTGTAANKGLDRTDLPFHDMTGGNTFMPALILDQYGNDNQHDINETALDSGVARATRMLQMAASMDVSVVGRTATVTVTNETGHKLPSGYPEGRRIWINLRAYDDTHTLVDSFGSYDISTGVLTKNTKIYEIKPGISEVLATALNDTGIVAGPSFHFVLNDTIYSDNRIPARGFTDANYELIQSQPVDYNYNDGQYWDVTNFSLSQIPDSVVVTLYYQTTSKEYIEFLRDENTTDTNGDDLYSLWVLYDRAPPVTMTQVRLGTSDITLPVNLLAFDAKENNGKIYLSWKTASESENAGFIVLRTDETKNTYTEIASYKTNEALRGQGNSAVGKEYSYVDNNNLEIGKTYFYKLLDVDINGKTTEHGPVSVTYGSENPAVVYNFELFQNYPNPFNQETVIKFTMKKRQVVQLRIYDINGRIVRKFPERLYYAGSQQIRWDGRDNFGRSLSSGTYIYHLKTQDYDSKMKMILMK